MSKYKAMLCFLAATETDVSQASLSQILSLLYFMSQKAAPVYRFVNFMCVSTFYFHFHSSFLFYLLARIYFYRSFGYSLDIYSII